MQLKSPRAKSSSLAILIWLVTASFFSNPALAIIYPATSPQRAIQTKVNFLQLETANSGYEKRLGLTISYSWQMLEKLNLLGQVQIAPDLGKDTNDFTVAQSLYSGGALVEYSYIYLFRFFTHGGPELIREVIHYKYRNQSETLQSVSTGFSLHFGIEYAVSQKFYVSYAYGYRWRLTEKRLDKAQTVGLSYSY